jgi:hypothetical protein
LAWLSPKRVKGVDAHDREVAEIEFAKEWQALEELGDSGHTPCYITYGEISQDSSMPYPDGYIRILGMSRVPGQNIRTIMFDLGEEERLVIRNLLEC